MPTTQPLTHELYSDGWLIEHARQAAITLARAALACPGMYQQASELNEARRAFRAAEERLASAEKAWAALIAPAAGWAPDPLKE